MQSKPSKEHKWLEQLIGDWTYEMDAPGETPDKFAGSESVRSLGGLWVLAEGRGAMPDGGEAVTLMTLGYDPDKKRFVGTFVASMMSYLWVYDGELDAAEKVLTLNADGPSMKPGGGMAKYRDIIEFEDDDHRLLTSKVLGDDGEWHPFMQARYRRMK
jgi:hypothetical protein